MNKDWIVHLCERSAWEVALGSGVYSPPSLTSEGFIHASRPEQLLEVANTFYSDSHDPVVLWINPTELLVELRWEQVGETKFPHLYGSLNLDAVASVTQLTRDQDGTYTQLRLPPGW
jgi:uncharacterized protein (DUF952 family)